MASVVSMSAWRRIFCATDGCTFARASSVAVVWRSEWKTILLRQRPDPERAVVLRAAAVRVVVGELDVAAAWLAAAVIVSLDDASAAESAAQDGLEVRVRRSLLAVRCREDPLRGRQLDGRVQVRPQRLRNRHRAIVPALRDIGIVRAAHRDRPVTQVDVFLLESQQFTAAEAEKERRRE